MFKVEFLPKITCYCWFPERPHRSTDMSSLSSTCHPLKFSIILTSEKRKKKYRDEKGCPDLEFNVPKKRQTVPAESEIIKYIPGKQSWQPVLPSDWELGWDQGTHIQLLGYLTKGTGSAGGKRGPFSHAAQSASVFENDASQQTYLAEMWPPERKYICGAPW